MNFKRIKLLFSLFTAAITIKLPNFAQNVPTFAQNVPTFEENVPTFEEIVPSLVFNRPTRV